MARANQVARYLIRGAAIGPETLVGICAERSLEMIVGLLGILKGRAAAYLPLDPSYPAERLSLILADGQVARGAGPREHLRQSLTEAQR